MMLTDRELQSLRNMGNEAERAAEWINAAKAVGARQEQLLIDKEAEIERLRTALAPFAEVGGWLFARPQVPDSTPVVDLRGVNGQIGALTRGDFKAANIALRPKVLGNRTDTAEQE